MNTQSIQEKIKMTVEDMSILDTMEEKFEYLMELSAKSSFPKDKKDDAHLIHGCQSLAWFHAENKGDVCFFYADGDSMIVRGILSLLTNIFSGHPAEEILQADIAFIEKIGLGSQLSSTRANSIKTVFDKIRNFATQTAGERSHQCKHN